MSIDSSQAIANLLLKGQINEEESDELLQKIDSAISEIQSLRKSKKKPGTHLIIKIEGDLSVQQRLDRLLVEFQI